MRFNLRGWFVVAFISRPSYCVFLLGVAAATLVAAGCSGDANQPYPVQGTVFLDGQPATELAGGTVFFNSSELHKSASGEIKSDGTYRLSSLKKDDGAIPGKYEVSISPPETSGAGERAGKRPGAKPAAFKGPEQQEVTVEAKSNDIPIQLKRSGKVRQ
jgi:hypothetical protein